MMEEWPTIKAVLFVIFLVINIVKIVSDFLQFDSAKGKGYVMNKGTEAIINLSGVFFSSGEIFPNMGNGVSAIIPV